MPVFHVYKARLKFGLLRPSIFIPDWLNGRSINAYGCVGIKYHVRWRRCCNRRLGLDYWYMW